MAASPRLPTLRPPRARTRTEELTPGRESLANTVQWVIRGQRIRLEALHETREAIEPACAALAARRRTERALAELDAAHAELVGAGEDVQRFLRANVRRHTTVARAGGNELLIGFMSALARSVHAATDLDAFLDAGIRELTGRAHTRITEAIRAGDEAAARRMTRHICGSAVAAAEVDDRESRRRLSHGRRTHRRAGDDERP